MSLWLAKRRKDGSRSVYVVEGLGVWIAIVLALVLTGLMVEFGLVGEG